MRPDDKTDFSLSELTEIEPERLVPKGGTDSLSQLMLALAVAFNDMKGLFLLAQMFVESKRKPSNTEISGHAGEWRGVEMQIHRLMIAAVYEILLLLKTYQSTVESPEMADIVARMPAHARHDWKQLFAVAIDSAGQKGDVTKVLVIIRNAVSYHYYQPKQLVAGYRSHFFAPLTTRLNRHAYASYGPDLQRTRFYYADAAVQKALEAIQGAGQSNTVFLARFSKVRQRVNMSIRFLLEAYAGRAA